MNAADLFSTSYDEARQRFVAAATVAGAKIKSHPNPHAKGPNGEALTMDTAWFGPLDAGTVLLNTCGVHGAEGYAGSAAQLNWIENGDPSHLPPDIAVLLVHAVNPFGFAWGLRGTENNVDLNRNWLDFTQALPENELYDRVHPLLCPKRIDDKAVSRLLREGAQLISKHGQWALEDAISRGQYTHPDGFHFGGHQAEWSTLTLQKIVAKELSNARQIGFMDWHTGPVGDGDLIFLCFSPPHSPAFQQAERWWGRTALSKDHVDTLWGSKRPSRCGIMFWGVERALGPNRPCAGAVIEFRSSLPKMNAADALRVSMLERWLRFEGGLDAPEAQAYLAEIREDYAPTRASFHNNVLTHSLRAYDQAITGLAGWQCADAAD
ncbi:MAG: M14 family metallopeptidase [Parvibaculum sp.]